MLGRASESVGVCGRCRQIQTVTPTDRLLEEINPMRRCDESMIRRRRGANTNQSSKPDLARFRSYQS